MLARTPGSRVTTAVALRLASPPIKTSVRMLSMIVGMSPRQTRLQAAIGQQVEHVGSSSERKCGERVAEGVEPPLQDTVVAQHCSDHCRRISQRLHPEVERRGFPGQIVAAAVVVADCCQRQAEQEKQYRYR
jgi:hypothetical protein